MVLVVPESVLENYACSLCGKFLSVLPVKIQHNRSVICGRCVKISDDGAESLYTVLAKTSLFKCINRFDGCRILLTSGEVVDHEHICKSREYSCPLCPANIKIPTYNFIKHFQQNHPKNILQHSRFLVDMSDLFLELIYLYRMEENLFLVFVNSDPTNDCILLKIKSLKNDVDGSTQTVSFQNGAQTFKTKKRFITTVESEDTPDLLPRLQFSSDSILLVTLELDLQQSIEHIPSISDIQLEVGEMSNAPSCTTVGKKENNSVEQTATNTFVHRNPCEGRSELRLFGYLIKTNNFETVMGDEAFMPYCYWCLEVICGKYYRLIHPNFIGRNVVCEFCKPLATEICDLSLDETVQEPFLHKILSSVLYYCRWGCEMKFCGDKLLQHERICRFEPNKKCPVEQCEYLGSLMEIKLHFDKEHGRSNRTMSIESTVIHNIKDIKGNKYEAYIWVRGYFVLIRILFYHKNGPFRITKSEFCKVFPENLKVVLLFNRNFPQRACLFINKEDTICSYNLRTRTKNPDIVWIKGDYYIKVIVNSEERLGISNVFFQ